MLIEEFNLYEIFGFEDQDRRNYDFAPQGSIGRQVEKHLSNTGAITPAGLSSIAANSMRLSSETTRIDLVNGWNAKRFRVHIKVLLDNSARLQCTKNYVHILGYTDRIDLSHGKHIAPDMGIYVNKIVSVTETEMMERGRLEVKHVRRDNLNVIQGHFDLRDNSRSDYLIRPDTIFRSRHYIDNAESYVRHGGNYPDDHPRNERPGAKGGFQRFDISGDGDNQGRGDNFDGKQYDRAAQTLEAISDVSSTFVGGTQLAEANDAVPSHFVHKLIKSDITAKQEHERHTPAGNLLDQNFRATRDQLAAENCAAEELTDVSFNPFMNALHMQSNYREDGFFEFRDMIPYHRSRSLDGLDSSVNIYMADARNSNNPYDISHQLREAQTVGWNSALPSTLVAAELCQSLPAIMSDLLLVQAHITADNHSRNGEIFCEAQAGVSYIRNEYSLGPVMQQLKDMFVRDVFRKLSHNGDQLVDLDVFCDVNAMIRVTIQVGGGQRETLKFPAFASSELTSMKTRGALVPAKLAMNYNSFRNEIDDTIATLSSDRGARVVDNGGRALTDGHGTFDISRF